MHSTYVDRGIIKWAPFDALVGYHGVLGDMKYRMGKKDQPILSDDQYQELNQKLRMASNFGLDLTIHYYIDGYIKTTFGVIKRIDWVHKTLLLTSFEKINAYQIVEIELT